MSETWLTRLQRAFGTEPTPPQHICQHRELLQQVDERLQRVNGRILHIKGQIASQSAKSYTLTHRLTHLEGKREALIQMRLLVRRQIAKCNEIASKNAL